METMLWLSNAALAMSSAPPGTESTAPAWWSILTLFGPFILIFYLMAIRPQQKQQREHQKLMDSIKAGDQVVLNSGIYGTVTEVKDKTLLVKIAENVKVKVLRAAVQSVNSEKAEKTDKEKLVSSKT